MAGKDVTDQGQAGKRSTFDLALEGVVDRASRPLRAFTEILEVSHPQCEPHDGWLATVGEVLDALLRKHDRDLAQALSCVRRDVGPIFVTAISYAPENTEAGDAGGYVTAHVQPSLKMAG